LASAAARLRCTALPSPWQCRGMRGCLPRKRQASRAKPIRKPHRRGETTVRHRDPSMWVSQARAREAARAQEAARVREAARARGGIPSRGMANSQASNAEEARLARVTKDMNNGDARTDGNTRVAWNTTAGRDIRGRARLDPGVADNREKSPLTGRNAPTIPPLRANRPPRPSPIMRRGAHARRGARGTPTPRPMSPPRPLRAKRRPVRPCPPARPHRPRLRCPRSHRPQQRHPRQPRPPRPRHPRRRRSPGRGDRRSPGARHGRARRGSPGTPATIAPRGAQSRPRARRARSCP
jgi:hypothetical protein